MMPPNHAPLTRPWRFRLASDYDATSGCNPSVPQAVSLSLGASAKE